MKRRVKNTKSPGGLLLIFMFILVTVITMLNDSYSLKNDDVENYD